MADLTKQNVTILNAWQEKHPGGRTISCREVQAVITAAGTTSAGAQIPASTFGLTVIQDCSSLVPSDNSKIVVASPNFLGTLLLCKASATEAPAATTGTFKFTIKGQA